MWWSQGLDLVWGLNVYLLGSQKKKNVSNSLKSREATQPQRACWHFLLVHKIESSSGGSCTRQPCQRASLSGSELHCACEARLSSRSTWLASYPGAWCVLSPSVNRMSYFHLMYIHQREKDSSRESFTYAAQRLSCQLWQAAGVDGGIFAHALLFLICPSN